MTNMSLVTTFILSGLPHPPELDTFLFGIFLVIYVLTVVVNLLILPVIIVDPHLHTPMHYFLANLSFIDMWYSTVTVPKMLMTLVSPEGSAIPFPSCVAQLYSSHFLGSTECFLYTVMSYDRFLAISYPLRYASMMCGSERLTCALLATTMWLSGSVQSDVQITLMFHLPFCGPTRSNITSAMHHLSSNGLCRHLHCGVGDLCQHWGGGFRLLFPDSAVLHIRCPFHPEDPHLRGAMESLPDLCLPLHCGLCFFVPCDLIYLRPGSKEAMDRVVAVFYTVMTPLLSPVVYTLRNKKVKKALLKFKDKVMYSQSK
ncbi:hypothetical protein FD755_011604 [Muntiacus reevesi]|uniref:G-protein coupled receptors family 1 profile domain-containing protein n=1 Tax=Muntiacus reevesi TaxID=9886 RepID=A0A5N3XT94_MUNRE|nr:hypothetical protein FD755_011604 [Muntiacus reevesi]